MSMQTRTQDLDVTQHSSGIVKHADLDVVWWRELMSHEVVLQQGSLPLTAQRGETLFTQSISPRELKSTEFKSIVNHLSELFVQWNGTVRFKLVLTLPMFVATKIAFAFIPAPTDPARMSVGTLASLQNSCVLNPVNNTEVVLEVPFVSTTQWLPMDQRTGHVKAALLEPIIKTQESTGSLPWTLFVSVKPDDFNFRYVVPPLIGDGNTVTEQGAGLAEHVVAAAMSTVSSSQQNRSALESALIQQPTAAPTVTYESMLVIPRTRIEFVMQKVRGQYPQVAGSSDHVLDMFDIPCYSFERYRPTVLPQPSVLFPYLDSGFLLKQVQTSALEMRDESVVVGFETSPYRGAMLFRCSEETANLLERAQDYYDLHINIIASAVEYNASGCVKLEFGSKWNKNGVHAVQFICPKQSDWFKASFGYNSYWIKSCMATWVFKGQNRPERQYILDALAQVDSCPAEVTHLALYSTMPPELAKTFSEWLITADNTSPPAEALSYSLSFSPNQAALAYSNGRFSDPAARGIVWKLFKLFKGDETAWWAWLIRGLDVVIDALIGTFLGRSNQTAVVPIGKGSRFRVEAIGEFNGTLPKNELAQLEYISPRKCKTLAAAMQPTRYSRWRHRPLSPQLTDADFISEYVDLFDAPGGVSEPELEPDSTTEPIFGRTPRSFWFRRKRSRSQPRSFRESRSTPTGQTGE